MRKFPTRKVIMQKVLMKLALKLDSAMNGAVNLELAGHILNYTPTTYFVATLSSGLFRG